MEKMDAYSSQEEREDKYLRRIIMNILRHYSNGRPRGLLFASIPYTVSFDMYQRAIEALEKNGDILIVLSEKNTNLFSDIIKIKKQKPIRSFFTSLARALKLFQQ